MREQEKQFVCRLLDLSPEHLHTLERMATNTSFDGLGQLLRYSLACWVDSVLNYRDRRSLESLNDVLQALTKELAERN